MRRPALLSFACIRKHSFQCQGPGRRKRRRAALLVLLFSHEIGRIAHSRAEICTLGMHSRRPQIAKFTVGWGMVTVTGTLNGEHVRAEVHGPHDVRGHTVLIGTAVRLINPATDSNRRRCSAAASPGSSTSGSPPPRSPRCATAAPPKCSGSTPRYPKAPTPERLKAFYEGATRGRAVRHRARRSQLRLGLSPRPRHPSRSLERGMDVAVRTPGPRSSRRSSRRSPRSSRRSSRRS